MTVLVTGGTGLVGRFIVEGLIESGRAVVVAGRTPPRPGQFSAPVAFRPFSLDPDAITPDLLAGCDTLVHAAFHHKPGRYRGGEGNDPETFLRCNVEGSAALFEAAHEAAVSRAVFLSSRAVYGTRPTGTALPETLTPEPETLYGQAKLQTERTLSALNRPGFVTTSLRVTGVYGATGADPRHKWADLFADFRSGTPIAPSAGTEVHGSDVAAAVTTVLAADRGAVGGAAFNVSDIVLDRRELLALYAAAAGLSDRTLPAAADPEACCVMPTDRLRRLGWQPGGWPLLEGTVAALAAAA